MTSCKGAEVSNLKRYIQRRVRQAVKKKADATQYPVETLIDNPQEVQNLINLVHDDFTLFLTATGSMAETILHAFPHLGDVINNKLRTSEQVWEEWAHQRALTPGEHMDQGKIHELERSLRGWIDHFAVAYNAARDKIQHMSKMHLDSSRK